MSIDRGLVRKEALFVRAVRYRHDVHVLKFGTGFTPVAMGQDVMPTDFAAGFNFTTSLDRPVKERIETRNTNSSLRRFHVFEERRKAPDDFSRAQIFRHPIKLIQSDPGFFRTR